MIGPLTKYYLAERKFCTHVCYVKGKTISRTRKILELHEDGLSTKQIVEQVGPLEWWVNFVIRRKKAQDAGPWRKTKYPRA